MKKFGNSFFLKIFLNIFLFGLCQCATVNFSAIRAVEQSLLSNILLNYKKEIRPEEPVVIELALTLNQIISIDEKNQVMTSNCYIKQTWFDSRLVWDPTSYNDIQTMIIPAKNIWLPDTFVLNVAESDGYLKINSDFSQSIVHYNGSVHLILPAVALKTRCLLYTRSFPFDQQLCSIRFSSWSQASNRILYKENMDDVDLSDYTPNSIWNIIATNVTFKYTEGRVPLEDADNAEINMEIYLKRKPLFFMMNGVFACLVLNCVTLLSYALPFALQVSLSMTSFMTFSVYSITFSNQVPSQSDFIPLISVYFVFSLSFSFLSLIWFVLCNQFNTNHKLPKLLLGFITYSQRLLLTIDDKLARKENKIKVNASNEAPIDKVECFVEENEKRNEIKKTTNNKNENLKEKPVEKCNICQRCEKCEKEVGNEKMKNQEKKEVEAKVSFLNNCIFIFAFSTLLIFQLCIWLLLSV